MILMSTVSRMALTVMVATAVIPSAAAQQATPKKQSRHKAEAKPKDCSPIERVWYVLTFNSKKCISSHQWQVAPPPPPPVPETPPPPPPPPAPEAKVCTPGPYIVFFEWDRSDITPEAASILDNAISNYADCTNTVVVVAGYTDTSGPARYNLTLSERRADTVRAYLGGKGIPDAAIKTGGFGESNPRVPTGDGVRELQNRRVEITYGPGSGY